MLTIDKALAVLRTFTHRRPSLTATEIGEALGLNKVAVHRLLKALESHDLVEKDPATRRYSLGGTVLELAGVKQAHSTLLHRAIPYLDRFRDLTGETAQLSVRKKAAILRVYVAQTRHYIRTAAEVGDLAPLHCTAAGKILLAMVVDADRQRLIDESREIFPDAPSIGDADLIADLEASAERGYAIDDQGYLEHLRAVAVPIRDGSGQVVAAVSSGGPTIRLSLARLLELADDLSDLARGLSRDLGWFGA